MVSAGTKSDQIMLVSDVFLLGVVKWVVIRDVILYAAILLVRWTIDCQQLLGRLEDCSFVQDQCTMFLLPRRFLFGTALTIGVESMLNLLQ